MSIQNTCLLSLFLNLISVISLRSSCPVMLIFDPLNEFETTENAFSACDDRGILLHRLWSKSTAVRLISQGMTKRDIEPDICPINMSQTLAWLSTRNISLYDICGVVCESDGGLRLSEELSDRLNLPTSNGCNEARRDKYMMQEAIKNDGLQSVKHILSDNWNEIRKFIESLDCPFPLVMKPCRGAASVNVTKVSSLDEAYVAYERLLGIPGYANGTISDAILVQEYIIGDEYAIDTVSRDGEHKITAIWKYDKRIVNNAPFVYFCTELVTEYNDDHKRLMNYTIGVLNSLKVKYGPAHIEVKLHPTKGPYLIETNIGRWHGQNFCKICKICFGYHAVELTIDAYHSSFVTDEMIQENSVESNTINTRISLHNEVPYIISPIDEKEVTSEYLTESKRFSRGIFHSYNLWKSIPIFPNQPTCAARIVHLVSYLNGTLTQPPLYIDEILNMESLLQWSPNYDGEVGETIVPTVDLHTTAGYALLVHPDKMVVDNDYKRLLEIQKEMYVIE